MSDYINGYIERKKNGLYSGAISIDGIDLGDIDCSFLQENGKKYLWLKRHPILEYDDETLSYKKRNRRPMWEVYMEKQYDNGIVAYRGEFTFFRFKYAIVGIWEKTYGGPSQQKMNLYVDRLPMSKQTIINRINDRKRNEKN